MSPNFSDPGDILILLFPFVPVVVPKYLDLFRKYSSNGAGSSIFKVRSSENRTSEPFK